MKNKIFLPVEPNGNLIIPAMVLEHLGLNTENLLAINLPLEPSYCMECEEMELNLVTGCSESLCNGYTTHEEEINLPQELLDLADIPSGAELTAIFFGNNILFTPNETAYTLEMLIVSLGKDYFLLPLENLGDRIE